MTTVARKPLKPVAIPTVPGTPFAGGVYVGRYFIGADAYALVVSPREGGEFAPQPWNESQKKVAGALFYADGAANTAAMAKAGSALAQTIRKLTIGGHKDWYLPSRLESLLLFGELRAVKAFDEKGAQAIARDWYWTSTQYAGHAACAWIQNFTTGSQHYGHKSNTSRARAVRRVPI